MMNVFFDCEMTHLWDPVPASPVLISIGCISEDGRQFYAENGDYPYELCNAFVWETVIPLLEGGQFSMRHDRLAQALKAWVESFDEPVRFWTDAPGVDWPHVQSLFESSGWPDNLLPAPQHLFFTSAVQDERFLTAVEAAFAGSSPALRRHHALDDAIANRQGYLRSMEQPF